VSYIYLKKEIKLKSSLRSKRKKILSGILLTTGIFFFLSAVFPIIKFQIEYSLKFKQIINPLSIESYNKSNNILRNMTTDYTQLSNWFVNDTKNENNGQVKLIDNNQTVYYLSIPKLNIKDAVVTIGSMDLKKSLIQYPQTALPGQLGNAVVFGHSVLPQFFNPKSYLTIFSTLYKLKQGDEIIINFDKSTYKYIIEEMYEIQPTDFSVLEQRFDNKNLTLITCSPPGTYLRRLVIKAQLAL
jgi:sortase A